MKLTESELRKNHFDYFLGKIVTLQTPAASVTYEPDERGAFLHFKTYGGICEGFDECGIWLLDTETNAKSFFFFGHIQGILEQPQYDKDHPFVKKALERASQPSNPPTVLRDGDGITENAAELTMEQLTRMIEDATLLNQESKGK